MSSQVEYEAFNVVPPMRNASGIRGQANVVVTTTSQDINLADYFGRVDAGHYFTFQADGAKVYVSFGPGVGAINDLEVGAGSGVCYPIPDGQQLPVRLLGGERAAASGIGPTGMRVGSGYLVKAKVAISGVATGFLRIYRSSVGPQQGVEQFAVPGF
jgi:hypothetical protein